MESSADGPLVVRLSPGSPALLGGRWGGVVLLAPGVVVTLVGLLMTALYARSAATVFFGLVIIASGLFGLHSGYGIRRLAVARRADPPIAFTLRPDGVEVGDEILGWEAAAFRVDEKVDPPTVVCGGHRTAWATHRLDTSAAEISSAADRLRR